VKNFTLSLILLALLPALVLAQTPTPPTIPAVTVTGSVGPYSVDLTVTPQVTAKLAPPCGCGGAKAILNDDAADIGEAFARGLGDRLAIGKYRGLTLALRQLRADVTAGRTDAGDRYVAAIRAEFGYSITPQQECMAATWAVFGLEMANAFGTNIPASVLAEAVASQKQLCNPPAEKKGPTLAPPKAPGKRAATTNWLSPQAVLDGCFGSNGGCGGDDNTTVLGFAKNGGIPLESDYGPYVAYSQGCQPIAAGVMMYTDSDWGYADSSTTGVAQTTLIKAAIQQYGGVGCAVATGGGFMNYSGGVFTGNSMDIDHDVYLVGWDDAKGAFLMVNSWGPGWGINPSTNQKGVGPVLVKKTGLKLPPLNVRQARLAAYRQRNMKAIANLAQVAKALPPAYNALATQPPIEDQGQCGSCWDFSGIRMVSAANILAGNLPKSPSPMAGGCMWISYGSNQIGTEAVWCVAGKPVPYVVPNPPTPPSPPSPTRRAGVLFEKATRLYGGSEADKNKVLQAIKAAEDAFNLAP